MPDKLNASVLDAYPERTDADIEELLAEEIRKSDFKFIVLDDDPTGVQTVHGIHVYTDWSVGSLCEGLREPAKLFYVLTNSRGMTAEESARVHREIGKNAAEAGKITGVPYLFMSRSDSTLRGHYPLEPEILKDALEDEGIRVDGEILSPCFFEGGRYTINNIHYVKYGDTLVPAAETEFAKDKSFGYTKSSIPEYIEEKSSGKFKAEDTVCIGLDELRNKDVQSIEEKLSSVNGFGKICLNAAAYCDLKVFALALYRAIASGKNYMFRTAAGLVKVVGGISDKPLLGRSEMVEEGSEAGGLIVVGSHTGKTTAQLEELLKLENTVAIPFDSDLVLQGDEVFEKEIDRCIREEEQAIRSGKTAVCYTNRKLLSLESDSKESALQRSVKISEGVQKLVGKLSVKPSFIIAKGGITSSDIGTKALGVRKALVLGQICPGIPVWKTDESSKFPGMAYVIFPGNVGGDETLKEAAEKLMGK